VESKFLKSVRRLLTSNVCPDEQALAAYSDRQLIGTERHAIEHHLSNCDACAGQVAFLVKTADVVQYQVPEDLMVSAVRMGKPQPKRKAPSWRLAGASALVLIVAISIAVEYPKHQTSTRPDPVVSAPNTVAESHPEENTPGPPIASPELRGSGVDSSASPFLFPVPNQTVDVKSVVFLWKKFDGAELYEIELLTDDGSYIWGQKVSAASVALPKSVHLVKGQSYFVKLKIHTQHGSVEQPRALRFIAG